MKNNHLEEQWETVFFQLPNEKEMIEDRFVLIKDLLVMRIRDTSPVCKFERIKTSRCSRPNDILR